MSSSASDDDWLVRDSGPIPVRDVGDVVHPCTNSSSDDDDWVPPRAVVPVLALCDLVNSPRAVLAAEPILIHDDSVPMEVFPVPKRGRGRPKKNNVHR